MSIRDFKGERILIWPSYFLGESRKFGRRFPKGSKPSLEEIVSICKNLGLDPEELRDKQYPRSRKIKGVIAVRKVQSKRNTLKLIFDAIKKERK
ncbi:signal recognition particle subunit SRP19/SEC65 family protein [Sulfuracidifex metallicus]|uniref:signal recognition particle subunit SRP19/SEC65 family protein n=1 Tax=Sulfuracidifex metallicus TaxID=47303 RepID=UPI002274B85E|nr:signal recognition particle subunit SRP19/SEC65 family protein [Sulfuracidifex metallicus]MCY0849258.1 signal recognition particle protein Srp19 [Sulfuracidifex metallicus]